MTHATTYTTQTVTWSAAKNAEKQKETEAEENTCDILSVYDSLNKLCETLSRLEYVIKKRNIETGLTKKR